METKFTREPWFFDKVITSCGHCFRIGSREQLDSKKDKRKTPSYACLYVDYGNYAQESYENARRICAAVNACEGISTESLEQGVIRELSEAAVEVIRLSDRKTVEWDRAKAALARARGEQS